MADPRIHRCEEDRHDAAKASAGAVLAQRGEVHALMEQNDFAHGTHGAHPLADNGTMKRAAFQGRAR